MLDLQPGLARKAFMGNDPAVFEATRDSAANLLKIVYSGKVSPEETRDCRDQIRLLLADLKPGFRLLSDFRSLDVMDLGCVPFIKEVMDLCNDAGISRVVRIIPDPHKDIGLNIMSLFHYRRGVRILTCETLDQAEKMLGPD
ncbi:MAG TPA: hypothetical protein VKY92_09000 [Verrucomicrobiae bacterium]|jgi:hypothetical protein|nr:hypothetical protein [Verrucomicrobiae bacterium]